MVFETFDEAVPLVGLSVKELLAQLVIKIGYQCRVGFPPLVRGYLLHGIIFPQAIVPAEGLKTTLYRHACSGKEYYLLHISYYYNV